MPDVRSRSFRWGRLIVYTFRVFIIAIAVFVISGSLYLLGSFVFDPEGAEEWTIGLGSTQFYSDIDHDLQTFSDPAYASIFGVAHNSGGSIEATLEARIYNADVIEVDVVEVDGVLYSAHTPPLPFIGDRWFRGPRLARVWTASFGAEAISLDLKESSPRFVRLVAEFLATRPSSRQVIVSSREPWVLAALREQAPDTILLLSVPDSQVLSAMQASESTLETIDGVTIRHSLLDHETAAWLTDHQLLIFAWTVDDLKRINELMALGVDANTPATPARTTMPESPAI